MMMTRHAWSAAARSSASCSALISATDSALRCAGRFMTRRSTPSVRSSIRTGVFSLLTAVAVAVPTIAASAMLAANSRARARLSAIRYGVSASRWSFRDRRRQCPESMNAGLWKMDSGLAAARRPGMTLWGTFVPARYHNTAYRIGLFLNAFCLTAMRQMPKRSASQAAPVTRRHKRAADMKTFSARPSDIDKKWTLIDADGLVLGRLASLIAMRLRGKHKPSYTPHMDCGDHI